MKPATKVILYLVAIVAAIWVGQVCLFMGSVLKNGGLYGTGEVTWPSYALGLSAQVIAPMPFLCLVACGGYGVTGRYLPVWLKKACQLACLVMGGLALFTLVALTGSFYWVGVPLVICTTLFVVILGQEP